MEVIISNSCESVYELISMIMHIITMSERFSTQRVYVSLFGQKIIHYEL